MSQAGGSQHHHGRTDHIRKLLSVTARLCIEEIGRMMSDPREIYNEEALDQNISSTIDHLKDIKRLIQSLRRIERHPQQHEPPLKLDELRDEIKKKANSITEVMNPTLNHLFMTSQRQTAWASIQIGGMEAILELLQQSTVQNQTTVHNQTTVQIRNEKVAELKTILQYSVEDPDAIAGLKQQIHDLGSTFSRDFDMDKYERGLRATFKSCSKLANSRSFAFGAFHQKIRAEMEKFLIDDDTTPG